MNRKLAVIAAVFIVVGLGAAANLFANGQQQSSASGSSGSASSALSPFVQQATAATNSRTGIQTWTGPTSGPKIAKGKYIVYIPTAESNTLSAEWGDQLKAICQKVGWKYTSIDGKGTAQGWVNAFNQAIALRPDGIISSANYDTVAKEVAEGAKQGIVFVGLHFTATPGPKPQDHVFFNIESSPQGIGKAMADFVIAKSKGKARGIILTDTEYAVARYKSEAARAEFEKCKTCKLLAYVNSPLSQVTTQMPQLMTSWVTKYGQNFWVMSITDIYYDFAVPTLIQGGVPKNAVRLVGSDGTPSAYTRIRNGNYQVATVPEPPGEQAYQAIDEFNRAFNKQKPSDFVPPAYIVDSSNINTQGGTQNTFIPGNNFSQHYLHIWGVN